MQVAEHAAEDEQRDRKVRKERAEALELSATARTVPGRPLGSVYVRSVRPRRLEADAGIARPRAGTRLEAASDPPDVRGARRGPPRARRTFPGVAHLSADLATAEAERAAAAGVGGVILFGLPATKDPQGSSAWDPDGPVQVDHRAIRAAAPGLVIATDVCLCQYTDHGHCGVLRDGDVDNDATLDRSQKRRSRHAAAGADLISPSGMMDGRVGAIREALDAERLRPTSPIMSYSTKFASAFYGPFRDAADSTPQRGDRQSYQMDPANAREALRESALDEAEGADV